MQGRVDRADERGNEPGRSRAAPPSPIRRRRIRFWNSARQLRKPYEQQREQRNKTDQAALGKRVDVEIVGMRRRFVARLVEDFSALRAPPLKIPYCYPRILVHAHPQQRKLPPGG